MKNVSISREPIDDSVNYILRLSLSLLGIVYAATVSDSDGNDYLKNIYLGESDTEPASLLEIASDNGSAIQLFKDDSLDVMYDLVNSNSIFDFTSILKINDYGIGYEYKSQKHSSYLKKEHSLPDVFHFRTIEGMPPASLEIINFGLIDKAAGRNKTLIRLTFKDMPKELFDNLEKYKANDDDLGHSYNISAGP